MFFTVVTSLIAVSAWLVFQIQNTQTENKLSEISSERDRLGNKMSVLNQYEDNLASLVGLKNTDTIDPDGVKQLKSETLEDYEGLDEYEGTLEDLARLLDKDIRRLSSRHRTLRLMQSDVERKLSIQKSRLEMYKDIYSNKTNNLTSLQNELDQKRETIEQAISNAQDESTQKLNALENDIKEQKTSHNEQMKELDIKRSGVKTSISELKQQQEAKFISVKDTDGKIIRTKTEGRWAYINIGKRDRVKAGMEFGVYSRSDGDERLYIGLIKVKQVFSEYASCKIISEKDVTRPVLEDYVISNPFFNIQEPKKIALIGSFPNKSKLENAIKAAGSTVQEKITPQLDFAIVGRNYQETDRFSRARELGVLLSKFDNFRSFTNN